ncbi:MAG: PAS domain-containing protein [Nitrosomonadales bacterium]|nr:PAS domain-containing protein [Nitrosomonadales bacterium]
MPSSNPSSDKLQGFIASLPGMACQIELREDGSIDFPYASEGCLALIDATAQALQHDSSLLLNLIHPDDVPSFLNTLKQSAHALCFWNWEGRITLRNGTQKWISLGATPQRMTNGLPRWEGILLDITQSKLGELEVKRAQQQLHELSSHIQDAKEQERLRIAREVHDEIGSLLTAIKIDLSWLIQRLPKDNPALSDKAQTIAELVNKTITAAGNLAHSLRPGFLDCFGLIAALEIEAQEFSKRSGIACTLTKSQDNIDLPDTHAITLFRIFQETLNNILKHAHAKNVQIEIVRGEDHLELIVADDGVGFDDSARNKPRSFGLRGIHERVEHLGGTVNISSTPGQGTQVAIFFSLPPTPETAGSSTQQQHAIPGNAS